MRSKQPLIEPNFPIHLIGEHRTFTVPQGVAVTVAARLVSGTWDNSTLAVEIDTDAGPFPFASAKSIAAGGAAAVRLSADDMAGVNRIRVSQASSVESGASYVSVAVIIESQSE